MILKKLQNLKQLINIYTLYQKSFPIEEKKPFLLILLGNFSKNNRFEIFSIEDKDKNGNNIFIGLSILLKYKDLILLDYLAIDSKFHSNGYGSKTLSILKEKYSNHRFFLEIENTSDINAKNLNDRIRRKKFYLKNGLTEIPFIISLFGVEMELLGNNCSLSFDEYLNIYTNQFGGYMKNKIAKNIKFIKNL